MQIGKQKITGRGMEGGKVTAHSHHSQKRISMLSAASQLIFAHKMVLPSWFLVHRFSCEHGICAQETTSEL
ncbi:hypothetical protein DWW59_13310 [Firmicutes bacterium AF16-15]|nr:hypothetical protein DWW59_13310 [Firmicutes bacterium AF16-15]